jgi:DNA repair protein RadC
MKKPSPPLEGITHAALADSEALSAASSAEADPSARFTSALYRTAARRAMHWLRAHLQGIPHTEIWMVTIDPEGTLTSSFCLTKGGIHRLQFAIVDLLLRAHPLAPAGIVLLQNRPGTIYEGTPIDLALSLQIALFCDLHGIPLIDHVYIDTQGYPYFVRERGHFQGIAPLRRAVDERLADLAEKEEERLQRDREEVERRTGREATAAAPPPEEPLVYRKRGPQKP